MKIKKLKNSFFDRNNELTQILYDKNRGYGIVKVDVFGYTFGIPLHSNVLGPGFITSVDSQTGKRKGLDFQKALIIEEYDLDRTFKVENYALYVHNKDYIIKEFKKYVSKYINDNKTKEQNYLNKKYRFSTLQNYHNELGI